MNLGVGSGAHARQTADIMTGFEPVLLRRNQTRPGLRRCEFDGRRRLGMRQAARPVAHIEAGFAPLTAPCPRK